MGKYNVLGHGKHFSIRLPRGLEYWKSSMAATFESKMAAIYGLFLHILASGAVRNLTVVFKHYV